MKKQLLVPQLSEDIAYHQFSSDSFFVHQKKYNHRIKITNDLYELLQKIDGKKNIDDLAREVGDGCDSDFIYSVLYDTLGKYGIIIRNDIEVQHRLKPDYLKLSFIVIPPEVISKITPFLKFLFRPKIMTSLLIFSLMVVIMGIVDRYEIIMTMDMESIWFPVLLFGFLSVTFHEFGHVTATDFFGAKHGGIGGGFYLFTPVYFADVTDIWKLKPKERIIVNLAGIYFELLICSLYVLLGVIFASSVLYLVGLLIFIKTLFNLNPFLRSDGYWVLTDALGIPNLYKTSSSKLKQLIRVIFRQGQKKFVTKDLLLALYASCNFIILIAFLYYVVVLDSNSIIFFPVNLLNFINVLVAGTKDFTLANIAQFALPFLFYYLLIKFVYYRVRKLIKS